MNEIVNEAVARIKIVGVGGGGKNAVEHMLGERLSLVDYVAILTDDGGYRASHAETKLQIGIQETKGQGAGGDPEKGFRSAQENRKEIESVIQDCDMLFIAAGMGGGTGTGAAPVVAEIAKKLGILTVAVVTTPFAFEGKKRVRNAQSGIENLRKYVDAIIIIPNDNLKLVTPVEITLLNAFSIVDDVLGQTVKNLVEVIQNTAFINCDFADIRSVLQDAGDMYVATGLAYGVDRVKNVVDQIQSSVLLGSSVYNATGIMLCLTAPNNVGIEEVNKVTSAISKVVSPNANIIFGMHFDETMKDELTAVLIATRK